MSSWPRPADRVPQLRLVGGDGVVDESRDLERIGGLRDSRSRRTGTCRRYCASYAPVSFGASMFLAKIALLVTPGSMIDDTDAERRELLGQALAETLERPLRRDVRRLGERGDAAGDRGDVDDGAAAALAHARQHLLQASNGAAQVDVHHVEVRRRRALLGDRVATDAGVVDQHVDDAVGLAEDLREAVAHRLVVGDVELDEVDLDAGLARHRLQLAGLVDAANGAVDGVALLREVDGGGATDAAVGAGDDGDGHAVMVSRARR